jgi:hypothetical protein
VQPVPQLRVLRDRLHTWVGAHLDELAKAEPDLPAEDRAADVWESLVAIADAAGGDWPERARQACKALAADARPDPDTAGERLLNDLYDIWGDDEQLFTTVILDRLCAIEEAPWATWHKGDRMSPRGLATLLKPWRVESGNVRRPEGQAKGYTRADLADPWERYVLPARAQASQASRRPGMGETAGDGWDGNGTDADSAIRPAPEQPLLSLGDAGTAGTDERPDRATCAECGEPMTVVEPGQQYHPTCEPAEAAMS